MPSARTCFLSGRLPLHSWGAIAPTLKRPMQQLHRVRRGFVSCLPHSSDHARERRGHPKSAQHTLFGTTRTDCLPVFGRKTRGTDGSVRRELKLKALTEVR